jgi:hypothetical protein
VLLRSRATMGCGASASRSSVITGDFVPEKLSMKVTEELTTQKPPNHDVEEPQATPEPEAKPTTVAESPPQPILPGPPEVFSGLAAGTDGRLPEDLIQTCLAAIGMRKSVLALALSPMAALPTEGAGISVAEWWAELNPRSRIVIEAKLRGVPSPSTLFGLAFVVAPNSWDDVSIPTSAVSEAELQATLESVGADEEQLQRMNISKREEACVLSHWVSTLSEADRSLVGQLLGIEDESPADSQPRATTQSPAVYSFHSNRKVKPEDSLPVDAVPNAVPEIDPLANAQAAEGSFNAS